MTSCRASGARYGAAASKRRSFWKAKVGLVGLGFGELGPPKPQYRRIGMRTVTVTTKRKRVC